MNPGLSTTNRAIEKASRVLEGFESDAEDHVRDILEEASSGSEGAKALFNNTSNAKFDPLMSKIILERENRKKMLSETASASQQISFMEWLGQADEQETKSLIGDIDTSNYSFYEEVQIMMEIWVKENWLATIQGKALARQACTVDADLPFFKIEDLKKSR